MLNKIDINSKFNLVKTDPKLRVNKLTIIIPMKLPVLLMLKLI